MRKTSWLWKFIIKHFRVYFSLPKFPSEADGSKLGEKLLTEDSIARWPKFWICGIFLMCSTITFFSLFLFFLVRNFSISRVLSVLDFRFYLDLVLLHVVLHLSNLSQEFISTTISHSKPVRLRSISRNLRRIVRYIISIFTYYQANDSYFHKLAHMD